MRGHYCNTALSLVRKVVIMKGDQNVSNTSKDITKLVNYIDIFQKRSNHNVTKWPVLERKV